MLSRSRFLTDIKVLNKITSCLQYSVTSKYPSFRAKDVQIKKSEKSQLDNPSFKPGQAFGVDYTDHLLEIDWSSDNGWEKPIIRPFSNFSIHPGAKVLHYAIELFEGVKAFYGVDEKVRIFRLEKNMDRMNMTASRSALPTFDSEELKNLIVQLVSIDIGWVPKNPVGSLYIRPTLIGTDDNLGLAISKKAKLFVIMSPSEKGYYDDSVTLLADSKYVRSFPGGSGQYKMGSNYAPTILISENAKEKGCDQVLWLHDKEEYLTEVGTMNIFVHLLDKNGKNTLVTPPIHNGLILPGVTRESIMALGREFGYNVEERDISINEVKTAAKEKRLKSVFGTGTAATLTPVKMIKHVTDDGLDEIEIPIERQSECSVFKLRQHLIDIYYGRIQRPEWVTVVQ